MTPPFSRRATSVHLFLYSSRWLAACAVFLLGLPSAWAQIKSNLTFAGGQFSFQVNGQTGPDYLVETSTNLITHWTPVHTANSPSMPFTGTAATDTGGSTQRFYRVKVGPPLAGE